MTCVIVILQAKPLQYHCPVLTGYYYRQMPFSFHLPLFSGFHYMHLNICAVLIIIIYFKLTSRTILFYQLNYTKTKQIPFLLKMKALTMYVHCQQFIKWDSLVTQLFKLVSYITPILY